MKSCFKKMENTITIDSNMVLPLGMSWFIYILITLIPNIEKANQFILGTLIMYLSWAIIYQWSIKPQVKEALSKVRNR